MKSTATTVEDYLAGLPPERREVVSTVREMVLRSLPPGIEETMNWGMISYELPLERFRDTYNGQPLGYVGLAAQKGHYALYLLGAYMDPEKQTRLEEAFRAAGKKLDMGRSCLRFKRLDDLPMDAIARVIQDGSVEELIERYQASRKR